MSSPQPSQQRFQRPRSRQVHELDEDNYPTADTFTIASVDTNDIYCKNEIHCTLHIHDTDIDMKVDTGAKCNVLPYHLYTKVARGEHIDTTKAINLRAYSGDPIHTKGEVILPCNRNGKTHM